MISLRSLSRKVGRTHSLRLPGPRGRPRVRRPGLCRLPRSIRATTPARDRGRSATKPDGLAVDDVMIASVASCGQTPRRSLHRWRWNQIDKRITYLAGIRTRHAGELLEEGRRGRRAGTDFTFACRPNARPSAASPGITTSIVSERSDPGRRRTRPTRHRRDAGTGQHDACRPTGVDRPRSRGPYVTAIYAIG